LRALADPKAGKMGAMACAVARAYTGG